jgi:hypothetical protein
MRAMLTTVLLAGAMASIALCDDGDFQWQGALKPGQLLEVRGLSGSIRAEGASDGTARVTSYGVWLSYWTMTPSSRADRLPQRAKC